MPSHKKTTVPKPRKRPVKKKAPVRNQAPASSNGAVAKLNLPSYESFVSNASLISRRALISQQLDVRRDINKEAGYPDSGALTSEFYRTLFDREGIATRVVSVFPEESWSLDPIVIETGDVEESEFEKDWEDLQILQNVYHFLERIDVMSGIGTYGILLLGIDDGKELSEQVEGINERGERVGAPSHKLLFLRAFDDSLVGISKIETEPKNPRFGQPITYNVSLHDTADRETGITSSQATRKETVHWSRVIHIADNRMSSEIFGVPRMRKVVNRLLDLRKLLAGSAEMFWKGGFPGFGFNMDPEIADRFDIDSVRDQVEDYMNGLQRYLAMKGVAIQELKPQVASPMDHFDIEVKAIAISIEVPLRIFIGSEAAVLASEQDKKAFNARIERRQTKYVGPQIIRPFIDRMIAFGALPEVERYEIEWPDLLTTSEEDKANVANTLTTAIAKYVQAGADVLFPPLEYLTGILGLPLEEAKAIEEAAFRQIELTEGDEDLEGDQGTEESEDADTQGKD